METELEWRALTEADAPAAAEVCAAAEAADDEGESYGVGDILEDLGAPEVDRDRGAMAAFAPDGRMAAYAFVFARTAADPVHEMNLWSVVHPEWRGRGVGTQLTERCLAAAREISELRFPGAPVVLQRTAYEKLPDLIQHLEKHGFTSRHFESAMHRPITPEDADAAPTLPAGLTLVGFTPELSEEFRATHNEAFVLDHPGSTPATPESWSSQIEAESFRADLTFALSDEAAGQFAGYVIGRYYEADTESTGSRDVYISHIGTRREYRGRGVASSAIAAVVHAAAEQGFDSASLNVRSDNPNGALGVYERAGFSMRRRFVNYVRKLS